MSSQFYTGQETGTIFSLGLILDGSPSQGKTSEDPDPGVFRGVDPCIFFLDFHIERKRVKGEFY